MWLYFAMVVLLVVAVGYPLQGWITYLVKQRRRERRFTVQTAPHRPTPATWREHEIAIAWLGHATLLINLLGKHVLTDPVFGAAIGIHLPFGLTFGPRRLVRCALAPADLPRLDLIVQSHAHMDHLDTRSWKLLPRQTPVVMAARNQQYIRRFGFRAITELGWGESAEVAGVRVTALEVSHWGERYPWSRGHRYNGYLLERDGVAILFGGDTAYTDSLRQACAGKHITAAILPIGGYNPYIRVHASPEQAWQMFRELDADYLIPIHHATFILSSEPPAEPLERLLAAAGDQADRVVIRGVGETFALDAADARGVKR